MATLFALTPALPACSVPQFFSSNPAVQTADQLLTAGHYRRALALLTAAPATPVMDKPAVPGEAAEHELLLSRTELGLGHLENALQLAEKAVAADPARAEFHVQLAAVAGRTAEHASMFKQIGLAKRAKKELDTALALDPKSGDALYGLVLFSDVAPSFIGGDKARAVKLAEQLTALDPSRGFLVEAELAGNRKDLTAQEAFLRKAVTARPENYDARMALAAFMRHAEPARIAEADEQACAALAIDPSRAAAWQLLSETAALSDCWREVDGLVKTAERFNPEDLAPSYAAAAVMVGAGKNLEVAAALLKHYLAQPQEGNEPSLGRARWQLGLALEKQGQREAALDLMRIAVTEDPTLEEARKDIKRLERKDQPAA